jgi:hypothetical protein
LLRIRAEPNDQKIFGEITPPIPSRSPESAHQAPAHEACESAVIRVGNKAEAPNRLTLSRAIRMLSEGTTVSTQMAALVLGMSERTLRTLLSDRDPPVEPLRYGKRLRWPSLALAAHVGISGQVLTARCANDCGNCPDRAALHSRSN